MFTRSVAVVIARPVDEVFAFVLDARNRPSWDDSVNSEELTSERAHRCRQHGADPNAIDGRDYEIDWRIVEHEAPTHQRIESTSGPFTTTLVYDLASEADGTLVEFSVTGRPTGPLRLLQPLIARTTQRNLDKGFAQLKQVLERSHFE